MAVFKTLARATAILGTGLLAFVIGNLAWAAISGAFAGFLAGFGVVVSAAELIALGPVAGGAVALATIMVVFD